MGNEAELVFRLIFAGILFGSLFISGYFRRKARASGETIARHAEGSQALFLRAAMAFPLLGLFLGYIVVPQWLRWATIPFPAGLRWAGAGLGALCMPLLVWVFWSIGDNISETVLTKKEHQLVMAGPYRWIRHPLYAFALVLLFSLGVIASNWLMIALAVVGTFVFRLVVIPREEENLIKVFGQAYEDYRVRTGALLPRIG